MRLCYPSPAEYVLALRRAPNHLPLGEGTSLAFSSGEGGALCATDEEGGGTALFVLFSEGICRCYKHYKFLLRLKSALLIHRYRGAECIRGERVVKQTTLASHNPSPARAGAPFTQGSLFESANIAVTRKLVGVDVLGNPRSAIHNTATSAFPVGGGCAARRHVGFAPQTLWGDR